MGWREGERDIYIERTPESSHVPPLFKAPWCLPHSVNTKSSRWHHFFLLLFLLKFTLDTGLFTVPLSKACLDLRAFGLAVLS